MKKEVMSIEEMIGILGELLDDTEHEDLPEYARKGIEEVYQALVAQQHSD